MKLVVACREELERGTLRCWFFIFIATLYSPKEWDYFSWITIKGGEMKCCVFAILVICLHYCYDIMEYANLLAGVKQMHWRTVAISGSAAPRCCNFLCMLHVLCGGRQTTVNQ